MSSSVERAKLEKLRRDAMRGKWSDVFETYKKERALRKAKITPTGDTVLHMAVSNGIEKIVVKMVDFLVQEESNSQDIERSGNKSIFLGVENDREDTPLHLAGAMGNDRICKKIGETDPSLIAKRNIDGETPLFLAALYGRRRTFLWLHYLYVRNHEARPTDFAHNCIRDNRDTILHCAIAEGHFGVAIEIVHLYKDDLKEMKCNNEGLTPLHLLAAQPSAFKTTTLLEVPSFLRLIYWCWKVEEKKQATTFDELQKLRKKYGTPREESLLSKFMTSVRFVTFGPPLLMLTFLSGFLQLFSGAGRTDIIRRDMDIGIPKMKEKHTRCYQIMTILLENMSRVRSRSASNQFSDSLQSEEFNETPLMIAVKNGVIEMVEKILEFFPSAIKDQNGEGKNILLLAVEYRQTEVFSFLSKQKGLIESVFKHTDNEGNNALHLAAKPGEIKWFESVKDSMCGAGLLWRYNKNMKTPEEMFRKSFEELMKSQSELVAKTAEACSVVSTLVVSVVFATRTSVPGGYESGNGYAVLRNNPSEFKTFRDYSFAALFLSLISTICFLSIVASSPSQSDRSFRNIASKFNYGVCFMFASIACLWISFCAADFFMLHDDTHKLNKALPAYILLSMILFLMVALQLSTVLRPIWSYIWSITPRYPISTL